MAAISRRRGGGADYTWPGYVDALTTLLMVLIFLLSVFSVAQFSLSDALTNKDSAIDRLNKTLGDLANQLAIEKTSSQNLSKELEQMMLQLNALRSERDKLGVDLAAQKRRADEATIERDALTERLTSMLAENAELAKEAETRAADMKAEIERQRLELTRLAAALAAANNEKGKLFSDLTEQEKLTAEQKAAVVRMTAEMAALKQELARLAGLLEAADLKAKEQNAQIVELGRQLNRALADEVARLAQYRSDFFGKLRQALAGQKDIQIVGDRFVFQSEVLFPSSSADLQPAGMEQLANVGRRLVEIARTIPPDIAWVIQVDGHTDNRPIRTDIFPSNWELSTARAIAVVKFLHSQGIANERLVAAGYGEFQPLGPNNTPQERERNRRIELKLTNR
jgi:chemotaxis protein MotB